MYMIFFTHFKVIRLQIGLFLNTLYCIVAELDEAQSPNGRSR